MARRKKEKGVCRICGTDGDLTFEHVPPRAAFNNQPVILKAFDLSNEEGLAPSAKGEIQQRGVGGHTLCGRCNNLTGGWFGKDYVSWVFQNLIIYENARGSEKKILCPYHIFPLRVIKQVICMFFSINSPSFREAHPYLVKFILNKEHRYLPPEIKIYTYLMNGPIIRTFGVSAIGSITSGQVLVLSEFTFPPMGYVLTFDSEPFDHRLVNISHFANYGYNEWIAEFLCLSVLPVNLNLPGDYRTKDKILQDFERNTRNNRYPQHEP